MGTKTYVVQVEASRAVMLQYWGPNHAQRSCGGCPSCTAWARWRKTKQIVITTTEQNTLNLLLKL